MILMSRLCVDDKARTKTKETERGKCGLTSWQRGGSKLGWNGAAAARHKSYQHSEGDTIFFGSPMDDVDVCGREEACGSHCSKHKGLGALIACIRLEELPASQR